MSERSHALDAIKGLAIVAVVLYHLGLMRYGYLGVDVFFVIAGYLSMGSVLRHSECSFQATTFMSSRLKRLLPIVLIASCVVLPFACVFFVPTFLRDTAGSIMASNLFLQNIQMWRDVGDYWDVANDMKPMMHLWYLGALMQMYLLFAICMQGAKGRSSIMSRVWLIGLLGCVSLVLRIIGYPDEKAQYYFPTSRFFEFASGVALAFLPKFKIGIPSVPLLESFGRASFSIYIWHQIVIALARYFTSPELSGVRLCACLAVIAVISAASFAFLERNKVCQRILGSWLFLVPMLVLLMISALMIHKEKGLIRDIPELGYLVSDGDPEVHAMYNERVRKIATGDFQDNGKANLLFVGDSFARDLVNVFLESSFSNTVNVSYCETSCSASGDAGRIAKADYILYSRGVVSPELPDVLLPVRDKVWVVGYKFLGQSIGRCMFRLAVGLDLRYAEPIPENITSANLACAQKYGEHYIDVLSALMDEHGRVLLFSEQGKLLTHDCYHFSVFGARYYSERLAKLMLSKIQGVK